MVVVKQGEEIRLGECPCTFVVSSKKIIFFLIFLEILSDEDFQEKYQSAGKVESKGIILVEGTPLEEEEDKEEKEKRRSPRRKKKKKKKERKRRSRSRSREKMKRKKEKSKKKSKRKKEKRTSSPQKNPPSAANKWLMSSSNMSDEERKKFMMLMGAKPKDMKEESLDKIKASKQADKYEKLQDDLEKQFFDGLYRGRNNRRGL